MYVYILSVYITLDDLALLYTSSTYISSDHIHPKFKDIDMRVTTLKGLFGRAPLRLRLWLL